ncbi:hypothetical protein L596_012925 [Steinernema carpocapsae]|uniref:Uncharacterized protein n=1 Tax=Steinernema carpocapsae TaxID=34508 RepID=A0A4V6A4X8_STECR|nr:hypothetical protein L596_012925 [Steinernema carpocapsae]
MSKPKPKMSQEASPSLLSPLFEKKPPRAYYPRCQKKAQMEKALLEKSACIGTPINEEINENLKQPGKHVFWLRLVNIQSQHIELVQEELTESVRLMDVPNRSGKMEFGKVGNMKLNI